MDYGNTKKTQRALVGLGSAALAAAVAFLTKIRRPEFPERDHYYSGKKRKKERKKRGIYILNNNHVSHHVTLVHNSSVTAIADVKPHTHTQP